MKSRKTLSVVVAVIMSICLSGASLYGAKIYQFQQGVWNGLDGNATGYIVQDTTLRGDQPITNSGTNITLITTRPGSGDRHPVLLFDVSAVAGIPVNQASLDFVMHWAANINYELELYAIPSTNTVWTESSATFNNQDQDNEIAWRLADDSIAANGSAAGISGTLVGMFSGVLDTEDRFTIDINDDGLAIIQQWLADPDSNRGFFLYQPATSAGGNAILRSSEYTTAADRPLLQIIPEPGTALLLALLGGLGLTRRRRWMGE